MAEHFTRFPWEKQANRQLFGYKHSKNSKKRIIIRRIFALLNNPLSRKLADEQANKDELNIEEVSMF